jgi:hypothetical protein
VNAVLSFLQEQRASAAVTARVLRDGTWQAIAAREPVRDDIVRARAGDFVPADLELDGVRHRLCGCLRLVHQRRRKIGPAGAPAVRAAGLGPFEYGQRCKQSNPSAHIGAAIRRS